MTSPTREHLAGLQYVLDHHIVGDIGQRKHLKYLVDQLNASPQVNPFMWVLVENGFVDDYTMDKEMAAQWKNDWPMVVPLYAHPPEQDAGLVELLRDAEETINRLQSEHPLPCRIARYLFDMRDRISAKLTELEPTKC